MASEFKDPTADVTNNWTKSTGTAGWDCINDAVREPGTPTVPGDYVSSSTASQVQECTLGAPSSPPAVAANAIAHVYAAGGTKRSISLQVFEGTTTRSNVVTVAAAAAAAWYDLPLTSLPSNWADLRIRMTCNSTSGSSATAATVYEAYIEYGIPQVVSTGAIVAGAGSATSDATRISGASGQLYARSASITGVGTVDSTERPYVLCAAGQPSGSSSCAIPVTGASRAGDGIVVLVAVGGTAPPAVTAIADGHNKYAQDQQTSASPYIVVWECPGSVGLTTSDQITVTLAGAATGAIAVVAMAVPRRRTHDLNALATGNSANPSVSGTPSYPDEIALGLFAWANAAGVGALTAPLAPVAQGHQTGGSYATAGYDTAPAPGVSLAAATTIVSAAWRAVLLSLRLVPAWYMSNARYIHEMYQSDPVSAAWAFDTPAAFAISTNPASTGIQDGFRCTPVLKYTSYSQFAADVAAGNVIDPVYQWLMYDPEYWGGSGQTPQAEYDDPWTYMGSFVTLAHANGYKVILAPSRDLGLSPTSVHPKGAETLDAWYLNWNVAGTAAGTGAEVVHVQAQADTLPLSTFTSFWASALAQIAAASATAQASAGVSTNYGTAADMAAAGKAVAPTTWGYWLNTSDATIGQASSFLELMAGQRPTVFASAALSGTGAVTSAATRVPGAAPVHQVGASVTGAGAIITSQRRVVARSSGVVGSGATTTSEQLVRLRTVVVSGAAAILSSRQRTFARSTIVQGTGTITSAASAIGHGVHLTASQIAGTGTVVSAQWRVLARSSGIAGTGTIASTGRYVRVRASATTGAGTIITAAATVSHGVHLTASLITGTGTVTSSQRRVVARGSQVTGTGTLTSSQRRVLARAALARSTGTISSTATATHPSIYTRNAAIAGTGTIVASTTTLGQGPTVETHPLLGGIYDTTLTGGTYGNRLGGTYGNTTGGKVKLAVTGGQVITPTTGGNAESHTGGHPDEPVTGGQLALATGGSHDESLTGGEVL